MRRIGPMYPAPVDEEGRFSLGLRAQVCETRCVVCETELCGVVLSTCDACHEPVCQEHRKARPPADEAELCAYCSIHHASGTRVGPPDNKRDEKKCRTCGIEWANPRCKCTYSESYRAEKVCRICWVCERWYWHGKDCASCHVWTCAYCLQQSWCKNCVRDEEREWLEWQPSRITEIGMDVCSVGQEVEKPTALPQRQQIVKKRICPAGGKETRKPVANRKWNKIPHTDEGVHIWPVPRPEVEAADPGARCPPGPPPPGEGSRTM